jgi:two-component system nitrogen regulation response regulator NtrX
VLSQYQTGAGAQVPLTLELPLREAREAFERAYFEHLLAREGGSIARVAEKSGLERTHLYRKLKALGITAGKREE